MLVNNCFVVGIFKKMCKMIERMTKYEKVIFTVEENEKIADATSKSTWNFMVPNRPVQCYCFHPGLLTT